MFELQVTLNELKGLPRLFDNFTRQLALKADEEYFPNIRQLIVEIDSRSPEIVAPKSPRPEYRLQWDSYRQGKRAGIDKVALKWLCWESDIVHDPEFAKYLYRHIDAARVRVVKGLVWSLHQKWSQQLPKKAITEYTAKQLASYAGTDRALLKWKTDVVTIIGENGPNNFAKNNLLKELKSPKVASKEWAVYEFSEYIYSAVKYAINICIEKIASSKDIVDYLFKDLFTWSGWESDRAVLDESVKKLLLHPEVSQIKDRLKTSILNHPLLGDPRLPANRNKWVGVESSAVRQFIIWLSKDDIHFFFDHVLKGQDPHGRMPFWLKYLDKIVCSRSLLSANTAVQFKRNIDINFGLLSNTQNRAAFILDFGKIVAVEFSDAGKGCVYLFQRDEFDKSIPDMWTSNFIPEYFLKNQDLPSECRVRHTGYWESKVENVLASYGIRLFSSYGFRL